MKEKILGNATKTMTHILKHTKRRKRNKDIHTAQGSIA